MCVFMHACVHMCVSGCVRACVCVCVYVCVGWGVGVGGACVQKRMRDRESYVTQIRLCTSGTFHAQTVDPRTCTMEELRAPEMHLLPLLLHH